MPNRVSVSHQHRLVLLLPAHHGRIVQPEQLPCPLALLGVLLHQGPHLPRSAAPLPVLPAAGSPPPRRRSRRSAPTCPCPRSPARRPAAPASSAGPGPRLCNSPCPKTFMAITPTFRARRAGQQERLRAGDQPIRHAQRHQHGIEGVLRQGVRQDLRAGVAGDADEAHQPLLPRLLQSRHRPVRAPAPAPDRPRR